MVPILEILLIQLQGGNNLGGLTPKTVWAEKLGSFFIKTWDSSPLPSIRHWTALPSVCVQEFPIKIGVVIVLIVDCGSTCCRKSLCILTLKQAENDGVGYAMLPHLILIIFLF